MTHAISLARCLVNRKFFLVPALLLQPSCAFSLQDASAALRPFYFIVHPDLFGKYPAERKVNENSLKILNEYLANQHETNKHWHAKLQEIDFYIKIQKGAREELRLLKLHLKARTLRDAVIAILHACDLPVGNLLETTVTSNSSDRPIDWHPSFYEATGKKNPLASMMRKPPKVTLRSWLHKNAERSHLQTESVRLIKEDIEKLLEKLKADLALGSIRCESVWGLHHFRGCLKSFDRMYGDHPEFFRGTLKGRTLVFSNGTGVNRFGEIILSSEDVPEYWYSLLMSVGAYNAVLLRLPSMESKLSSLLNNISIMWREQRHCMIMAEEYELLLNRILNSLRQQQDLVMEAFSQMDLSHLHLVVEREGNPMMISATGQFLIPASIPANQVIDFIKTNQYEAAARMKSSEKLLTSEEEITQKALDSLRLKELKKDESVGPTQMITCCQKLYDESDNLRNLLENKCLRVSHYYSVMQDGEICLPWNWSSEEDEGS